MKFKIGDHVVTCNTYIDSGIKGIITYVEFKYTRVYTVYRDDTGSNIHVLEENLELVDELKEARAELIAAQKRVEKLELKEQLRLNKEDIYKLQNLLLTAFNWHNTPQGHKYWQQVRENLQRLEHD